MAGLSSEGSAILKPKAMKTLTSTEINYLKSVFLCGEFPSNDKGKHSCKVVRNLINKGCFDNSGKMKLSIKYENHIINILNNE